jgi:hypothetical protein
MQAAHNPDSLCGVAAEIKMQVFAHLSQYSDFTSTLHSLPRRFPRIGNKPFAALRTFHTLKADATHFDGRNRVSTFRANGVEGRFNDVGDLFGTGG